MRTIDAAAATTTIAISSTPPKAELLASPKRAVVSR